MCNRFIKTAVSAITLLGCITLSAQSPRTIKGTVTDADTDMPIAAVVCMADNTSDYAVTDDYGSYTIDVNSGTKSLTFSILGYQEMTVDLTGGGEAKAIL